MCTPWDQPSVDRLAEWGVAGFKVASADMTNHTLLRHMASYGVPMVISTGMSTEAEILETVDLVRSTGASYALLHCQSTYPAPFKDVNLRYLERLAEIGECPVGYSGHERGFHVPLAAVALGAKIVEKHFTTDRSLEGNDHKVSLLPEEFGEMVQRIRELEESLGTATPRAVSTGEMMNRVNLAKSLVAATRIEVGDTIARDAVDIKSPGRGLQPNSLDRLVGRTAMRTLEPGDFFYASDLGDAAPRGRQYDFKRPVGPARPLPRHRHDDARLHARLPRVPPLLQGPRDRPGVGVREVRRPAGHDVRRARARPVLRRLHHRPGQSGPRPAGSARSSSSSGSSTWPARCGRTSATGAPDPVVICTMGGFKPDRHLPASRAPGPLRPGRRGAARIDESGVRLTAQTLPPFPWLMGGQQFHNLFVSARDTAAWAEATGRRLTLDISHTKLAANFDNEPFSEYVELLAPHTEHLHLVDATGVDGEGVQVGDGEVDWALLARQLDELSPGVGFIPEIWQGHVNDGEGFWIALERLEQWF